MRIDAGSRDFGPLSVNLYEIMEDTNRVPDQVRVQRILDQSRQREKSDAQLVKELVDLTPPEAREAYRTRVGEVDELAGEIAGETTRFLDAGDPVIDSHSRRSRKTHPLLQRKDGVKYVRDTADPYRTIVREIRKRVAPGGEITLSGGYFPACIATAATHLAAAGYAVQIPEKLTEAEKTRTDKRPRDYLSLQVIFYDRISKTQEELRQTGELDEKHEITARKTEKPDGQVLWTVTRTPVKKPAD
ncbi:MAG: hypothetical protein ABIH11_07680 [Candidatus Altiarchaeota archaeon]